MRTRREALLEQQQAAAGAPVAPPPQPPPQAEVIAPKPTSTATMCNVCKTRFLTSIAKKNEHGDVLCMKCGSSDTAPAVAVPRPVPAPAPPMTIAQQAAAGGMAPPPPPPPAPFNPPPPLQPAPPPPPPPVIRTQTVADPTSGLPVQVAVVDNQDLQSRADAALQAGKIERLTQQTEPSFHGHPQEPADEGTEVTVSWGEEKFSPVQYNSFSIGPYFAKGKTRAGESVMQASNRLMRGLCEFAEHERKRKVDGYLQALREIGRIVGER